MEVSSFPEVNCVLSSPERGDQHFDENEPSVIFSGMAAKTSYGGECVVLCFKMTQAELQEITRTGKVWLVLHGPCDNVPVMELEGVCPIQRKEKENVNSV